MIAADAFQGPPEGLRRCRGGFMRSSDDGPPWVTHPTETTKHDGLKADLLALCAERGIDVIEKVTVAQLHDLLGGRPKRVMYSSTSNFGTLIENRGSLEKWSERKVVEGLLADPSILHLPPGDITDADLDKCVNRAKRAADAWLAADRGTHIHTITEHVDTDREWSHLLAGGEALGIDHDTQRAAAAAWSKMLTDNGLEVLEVERAVVDDEWRCAGTLDRVVRCTRDLTFARKTGEVVTVPAGTIVVLDIKTGSLRLSHAIQIASYAASVPYDTEAETRGEWDL